MALVLGLELVVLLVLLGQVTVLVMGLVLVLLQVPVLEQVLGQVLVSE